jgi:hypothetical protein
VSAADVMDGRVAPDAFRDKLVFVGATALGTQELVATPHDPRFIGVEVQATVADNLLQGDFFHRPAPAPLVEGAVTMAAAALVALTAVRFGAAGGAFAGLACLIALWGGAWWLLGRWGLVLSPVLPSASTVFAVAGVALTSTARAARRASADLLRARADAEAAAHAHHEFLTTVSRELRTPALRHSGLRAHDQPRRAGRRSQAAGAGGGGAARGRADSRHRRSLRGVPRRRRDGSGWCVSPWTWATSCGRRPTPCGRRARRGRSRSPWTSIRISNRSAATRSACAWWCGTCCRTR